LKSDRPKGRRLPANHAFVVQLSGEAVGTHDSFCGRVEHVVSGRVTQFETLEELLVSTPDRNCIGRPEQKYITG